MAGRPKVFVTRKIPEPGLDMLKAACEVYVNPEDRVLTKQEIMDGVKDKDALLCLLTDTIDGEVMDAGPSLKVIANYAVGYNNIDIAAATARRIPVSNTPGVLTETTADLTWALLMAVARRIVEGDKFVRAGKFKGWGPLMLLGTDVYGKTLGIIGLGRIGEAVARRARGFGMRVIYTNSKPRKKPDDQTLGVEYRPLDRLLQEADFISIHAPLTEDTYHLVGEKELKMMKKSAYLINTSRGPVVDEKALVRALQEGEIAGAGLDVFENEPEIAPGLAELDNVVIIPHLGSASLETRTKMATMAAANILAGLRGEVLPNLVNREILT